MKKISDQAKSKKTEASQADKLRLQAEELYRQQNPEESLPKTEKDPQRSFFELQIHQIELEIQNKELQQAQAELEKSHVRYSNLFDFAPVGYLTLSAAGIILEANYKAATMLGVVKSRLVERQLANFILPADMEIYSQFLQTLYTSGTPQGCEIRLMKNDGTSFYVYLEANLALEGERSASECHITLTDITERKKAEEQTLHESEQRYFSLFNGMADGVYRSTPQGRFVSVNPAMVKMFGYASQKEMLAVDIKKELYFSSEVQQNIILHTNQQQGAIESFRMRRKALVSGKLNCPSDE